MTNADDILIVQENNARLLTIGYVVHGKSGIKEYIHKDEWSSLDEPITLLWKTVDNVRKMVIMWYRSEDCPWVEFV